MSAAEILDYHTDVESFGIAEDREHAHRCQQVWASVLKWYITDAKAHVKYGRAPDGGEAFADLTGDCSLLAHVCVMNDLNLESTKHAILCLLDE